MLHRFSEENPFTIHIYFMDLKYIIIDRFVSKGAPVIILAIFLFILFVILFLMIYSCIRMSTPYDRAEDDKAQEEFIRNWRR